MNVLLTPRWKFVCDRCGKEIYPDLSTNNLNEGESKAIEFRDCTDMMFLPASIKRGNVCKDCFNDFVELANNFFDEVNKVESEDKE